MNLLLDTHTVLWFLSGDEKLSEKAKQAILSTENSNYVSLVSVWELSIKISLGKIEFEGGAVNFLKQLDENGFDLLPISPEHITRVELLPFHHCDPFDRLLVTTALVENMVIVTADTNIPLYNAPCFW